MFDVDDERNPEEKKNGFVFDDANEGVSIFRSFPVNMSYHRSLRG